MTSAANPLNIEVIRLPGLTPYPRGLELQRERHAAVAAGQAPPALFLLEHEPVITIGRETKPDDILHTPEALAQMGVAIHQADRGGEATYHGPGQLVAYPIINLQQWRPSIKGYLRALEQTIIQTIARYDLKGERIEGLTGVWVNGAKIAAVGIAVRKWTTLHGIALNVNPDMSHFQLIIPCGIKDKPVTSLHQLLPNPPTLDQAAQDFQSQFLQIFQTS